MQAQKSLNNLFKVSQGQDEQGLNADRTPSFTPLEKERSLHKEDNLIQVANQP